MRTQSPVVLLLNTFGNTIDERDLTRSPSAREHLFCETPLGIAYIYSYVKQVLPSIDCFALDAQAVLVEHYSNGMENIWSLLMEKIRAINPDVIGLSACYYKCSSLFHDTCKRIKEILPDCTIVGGGNYPTDAVETVLDDPNVDFVILSEGEVSFATFLSAHFYSHDLSTVDGLCFKDKNGNKVINPKTRYISDLSILPIPDRSVFPTHLYWKGRNILDRVFTDYKSLTMMASRGCSYACAFCSNRVFGGKKIRYRSVSSILDEMEVLKSTYGATVVALNDDNFFQDKAIAVEVMRGIISRKLDIKWFSAGGSNVRAFNDDRILDLAVESGFCLFNLAIESSSNETLKRIKKPLRVEESISVVKKIRTRYPHIWICANFMVGFPFEKRPQLIDTLDFSESLDLDWCTYCIFQPYPKTELHEYCVEHKYIEKFDFNFKSSFSDSHINGEDWTSDWLYKTAYEYNLRVNFLNSRNLTSGRYEQALRDFEYVISIAPNHAVAYRQAALAASKSGDERRASLYREKEKEIMKAPNEFSEFYSRYQLSWSCAS